MDAPPLSSDPRAELAALRRRAYGPNADIHEDAAALARLNALEDAVRAEEEAAAQRDRAIRAAERNTSVDEPSVRTTRPSAALIEGRPPLPEVATAAAVATYLPEPPVIEAAPQPSEPAEPPELNPARSPWWRRIRTRWVIVGAVVVGLIVGLALPMLMPPFPDATLSKVGERGAPMPMDADQGAAYGADEDSGQLYEQFRGMDVWSVQNSTGGSCIYVSADGDWISAGCAPDGLAVIVDATAYPGALGIMGDMPEGSVIRFEMRGDVIDVWVVEADEPA